MSVATEATKKRLLEEFQRLVDDLGDLSEWPVIEIVVKGNNVSNPGSSEEEWTDYKTCSAEFAEINDGTHEFQEAWVKYERFWLDNPDADTQDSRKVR